MNKSERIKEIDMIDKLEAEGKITEVLSNKRTALKTEVCQDTFKETQMWAQKCKRMWNLEGTKTPLFSIKSVQPDKGEALYQMSSTLRGKIVLKMVI